MELLTVTLKPAHREAGLYLEEDEDFVYLKDKGKMLSTWHGRVVTIDQIWEVADQYLGRTCWKCGHKGTDVREEPTHILGRDTTEYFCDNIEACLDRSLPSWYKRQDDCPHLAGVETCYWSCHYWRQDKCQYLKMMEQRRLAG